MIEQHIYELSLKQDSLDQRIYQEHKIVINNELLKKKVRAFRIEVCEFHNCVEDFKYWKKHKGKEGVAEEYIDGLHFLLSIGVMQNYPKREIVPRVLHSNDISEQLDEVHLTITQFLMSGSFNDYLLLFRLYLGAAEIMEYTEEFILEEYNKKYIKNLNRVKVGY